MRIRLLLAALGLIIGLCACSPSNSEAEKSSEAEPRLEQSDSRYQLVPRPAKLQPREGEFVLNADTVLQAEDPDEREAAEYFAKLIAPATGFQLVTLAEAEAESSLIRFSKVSSEVLESDHSEAYRLEVGTNRIEIQANTKAGLFHAVQTLRQLLPHAIETPAAVNHLSWTLPAVSIEDQPLYHYRGMHLDVARSFYPVSFIKRYLDLLALHKLNYFHWHLTDDQGWRIEIDAYPRLTDVGAWRDKTVVGHTSDRNAPYDHQRTGGYYTKEQIRDIVAYATERQITVVPEIDIPGHASAILAAYPEFACQPGEFDVQANFGIFPEVLCPRENTFDMLAAVFTEVAELFPGEFIHLGGDEVLKIQWQNCPDCAELMAREQLADYHELQSYFVGRVADVIRELGRKPVGWNEILEGGAPEGATVVAWQGIEAGIEAARQGHDAIMAPVSHLYFDFYQSSSSDEPPAIHGLTTARKTYSYDPMPEALRGTPQAKHIIGAQGQLWTEYMPHSQKAEYMLLPRLSALSEIVWTPREKQSWEHFSGRLDNLYQRFDQMRLNAARSVYGVKFDARLMPDYSGHSVELVSEVPGQLIRFTTDGSRPTAFSALYEAPLNLNGNVTLKARAQNSVTGELYPVFHQSLVAHKALGATLKLETHDGVEGRVLLDGKIATDQIFQREDWVVLYSGALDARLELADTETVEEVIFGFNPGLYRRMYPPSAVEVLTSVDGQHWQSQARQEAEALALLQNRVKLEFAPVQARFLKLLVEHKRLGYSAEKSAKLSVPLHLDEIIVD